ncbi:unnamed protein product, partial [Porites evermanni]
MVISGDAGMGKSVISAVVCQRMRHAGRLTGSHFCQHNKARPRNPKIMLQSLAYQLSEFLPPYKRELVKALSRNLGEDINNLEVGEVFELLFEEPLINVDDPGRSLLMVIDGLDESEYKGRNELLDVMANQFSTLPGWVRFCVTTRPEINIADRLKKFNPVLLEQDDKENVEDIRLFLERQLRSVIQSGFEDVVIDALVRKAAGHFLYAYLMVDFIKKNNLLLTPEELGRILPSGVSSVYQSYFERLENELKIGEDQFLTFLSALAAAREPLPLDFVSNMLISDSKSPSGHRKERKAIDSISTLLPVHDDCIVFFHKSVKDWLTDRTAYGRHDFSVDEKHGHVMLSQLCTDELSNVKRKGVHGTEFGDIASQNALRTLLFLLRKYHERLSTNPTVFLQVMVNEGGDVFAVNADSMITDCPKDAKCLVMWSLETGGEITRSNRGEVVLSFAWSPDRKLLAISHLSRLVCLVDALNCFETLAEVTTFLPCGMIKFAPNLKFLFCWCKPVKSMWERYPKGIRLDIMKLPCGTFSFNVVNDNVDYEPWDYESSSKAGFLMGDPVSCLFRRFQDILGPYWTLVEGAFAFVLSKQSVLRVFQGNNRIAMFSPDEMKITRTISCKRLGHVAFAVDGKSVYGVTVDKEAAVVSFDVLSGKRKSKIEISTCRDLHYPKPPFRAVNGSDNGICLVPVTDGVLVKQRLRRTALQLWNFELSQQVQSWPRLSEVTYMMPVTDQCVACVGKEFEVSILDTSSGEIVKTISLCHEGYQSTYPLLDKEAIVCNSKYQLLSTDRYSVQLSDSTSILWK